MVVVCMGMLTTVETLDDFQKNGGHLEVDANTSGTFVFIGQEDPVERTKYDGVLLMLVNTPNTDQIY